MNKTNLPETTNSNQIQNTNTISELLAVRSIAMNPLFYNVRITRNNPAAIVILLDQSGSMNEEYKNEKKKSEVVADVINDLLNTLLYKCQREGVVRDYFQILIIGYGQEDSDGKCEPIFCWEGNLENKDWVKVSELKNNELKTLEYETQEVMPWGEVVSSKNIKKIWMLPWNYVLKKLKSGLMIIQILILQ